MKANREFLDGGGHVAGKEQEIAEATTNRFADKYFGERSAGNRQQRLGCIPRQISQTRAHSAKQNCALIGVHRKRGAGPSLMGHRPGFSAFERKLDRACSRTRLIECSDQTKSFFRIDQQHDESAAAGARYLSRPCTPVER